MIFFSFLKSVQAPTSLLSAIAALYAPSMDDGTPVVFIDGQFEANPLPGAGIIAAGLLEYEFRMPSKTAPDAHMNRLSTDSAGCLAVEKLLLAS